MLLDNNLLSNKNPYSRDGVAAYLTGLYPYRIIRNNQNTGGPKALVIGDVHMLPVSTFLATGAGELHLIWPYTLPTADTLPEFINLHDFDIVLVGLNPHRLTGAGLGFLDGITIGESAL